MSFEKETRAIDLSWKREIEKNNRILAEKKLSTVNNEEVAEKSSKSELSEPLV